MNSPDSPHTASPFTTVASRYSAALQAYLAGAPEENAHRHAYDIGRGALASGLEVIDLASIHQIIITSLLCNALTAQERVRAARLATAFFYRSLEPFVV